MKTSMKLSSVLAGAIFASFTLGVTLSASAQDKPKGKPWAAPEASASVKNPVKSDAITLADGKTLYNTNCKTCHGVTGKGDGPKAEKIEITCGDFGSADFKKESDGAIFWKTTEGRKPMPSYKEKLTDTERWTIVNYMRTLK